jgi:PAS domain S-box-containing protein
MSLRCDANQNFIANEKAFIYFLKSTKRHVPEIKWNNPNMEDNKRSDSHSLEELNTLREKISVLQAEKEKLKTGYGVSRTDVALDGSEDQLRMLADESPNMIFINQGGRIVYANSRCMEVMGYNRDELLGPSFDFRRLIAPESLVLIEEAFKKHLQGKEVAPYEYNLLTKQGGMFAAIITTKLIVFCNHPAILGFVTDISDRKQMEEELRASHDRYRTLFDRMMDGVYRSTHEGKFVEVNEAMVKMFGYSSKEEMLSINIKKDLYFAEEDRESLFLDTGEEKIEIFRMKRKDGSEIWVEDHGQYVHDEQGNVKFHEGILRDVTQRIRIEKALRDSEERYRSLFDRMMDGIYRSTHDGRFVDINPAMVKMFGFSSKEEMLNVDIKKDLYFAEEDRDSLFLDTGLEKIEIFPMKRKDGSEIWVEDHGQYVHDENGNVLYHEGILRDVTERKRIEEELKKSEERYRKFFEEDLTGAYISTMDGRLIDCNPAFARIFGFSSVEDALSADIRSLYTDTQKRTDFLRLLRQKKKLEYYEGTMRRRDGKLINIIENAIGVFDDAGELVELKGYIFDDTPRKRLEQELIRAQKLESIGTLASGVAHDFNNILGIIMGYNRLLQSEQSSPEVVKKAVAVIDSTVQRGASLVRQILTFARQTEVIQAPLDANAIIRDVAKMLVETFPRFISIDLELDDQLPLIIADQTQFHQVLLNLCVNARDAMPGGGRMKVKTEMADGSRLRMRFQSASELCYLHLSISDTGIGMTEEMKNRIFEPFFTTKDKGKGTGLGLAVVYGVVTSHKGFINVDSEYGRGSTFHLYFPIPPKTNHESRTEQATTEEMPGGNETILIIEDEEFLIEYMEGVLRGKGYQTLTARDGEAAIEIYKNHGKDIDLVVSDLGLPRLSGRDVFTRLKEINPGLKLVVASGYIEPELRTEMTRSGAKEFLQKPYQPSAILKCVRKVLDS